MIGMARLRNSDDSRLSHDPGKRHLRRLRRAARGDSF
jgi:hypothetical protein